MSQDSIKSEPECRLLQDKNFGFLATVKRDGSPQVTPPWRDTDGEHILVNTATGRLKYDNILRDSRVANSVADKANHHNMMTIRRKMV
jgi:predicted pyridoxine 5'-phosphate oxidase superfamily flavin-nucleotide-binding protein